MPKKKLLIVGGGYADIPLIKAAQSLGYYVITSGNRADELGHKEADEYQPADFSDPEAVLQLAKRLNIDAICPCANDFSATTACYVAEKLGLPGHDNYQTSLLIHHKDSYRRFALNNRIPTPKAYGVVDIDEALSNISNLQFPLIVKPVDLTGGKGITKIEQFSDAKRALEYAFSISKAKRVVVEEFITGSRHGFSALLWNGRVVFHFMDNEHYYLNPYIVSAASTPAHQPEQSAENLIQQTEKIASILNLQSGIFHVQYILHNNEPVIIEICRRPPGDLYIQFVQIATGLDYPSWIVKSFIGLDCSSLAQKPVSGFFTRHCIMADRSGVLKDIIIAPEIEKNIVYRVMWWWPGIQVDNHLLNKFGIVFLQFHSMDEMLEKTERLPSLIDAKVSE